MPKTQPHQPNPEVIETLKSVSIFKGFVDNAEELNRIAGILETKKVTSGEVVIEEGDTGDTLFIMKRGAVNILKNTLEDEKYTVVRLESSGDMVFFFGELALLDNDKRSATVTADSDCEFLVMKREDFIELGDKYPQLCLPITREISKMLASRLRKANQDIITLFEALVGEVSDTNS
jgi:CRP-like cAMP-binding protein